MFWISDLGVRYGMEAAQTPGAWRQTGRSARHEPPNPYRSPGSLLSLFAPGPTLSKDDALVAH